MTPRSIRRAAERKALKTARKAERLLAPELQTRQPAPEPQRPQLSQIQQPASPKWEDFEAAEEALCYGDEPIEHSPENPLLFASSPLSRAQLAANRSNAQLSSGSNSPEGKAISSLNAVKTALTGRTVLLPTDDAPEYERHLRAYIDEFSPAGQRESDLVQSVADTMWRLKRIPCLESALFAQGYIEFGEAFEQHEPSLRSGMIELQTFIKYEKQLRNLQLQEARLARRREKEMAELRLLQQDRKSKEREALETVSSLYLVAKEANLPFEPAADGFVFSIAQIERHLERVRAKNMSRTTPSGLANPAGGSAKTTKLAA